MKKNFLSLIKFLILPIAFAQNYPQNYFRYPLEIDQILAGSFAELRGFHFHSGIDIKTQQREGQKVFAVAEGYISRISVSPSGYGNALYITHPNGYTSVYAHLQKFQDEIGKYVTAQQNQQKSFEINIFPPAEALPVNKGEFIALTGNSGSSGGPHLHFEIRDTKTEETINPFLFGLTTPDHKNPLLNGMYIYAITGDVEGKKRYDLTGAKDFKSPVLASGTIGVGVKAYDKMDFAENLDGIYSIEMWVNNQKYFTYEVDRFSFSQTRMINCQTDYEQYMNNKSFIYKLFLEEGNSLTMVKKAENNGYIDLIPNQDYQIKVVLKDFAGNQTKGSFTVRGKENSQPQILNKNGKFLKWNEENHYDDENVSLYFPAKSFYQDLYLKVDKIGENYFIQNDRVPLHKFYTLAIKPKNLSPAQLQNAVIAVTYNYGNKKVKDYFETTYQDGKLIAQVRDFGQFTIEFDREKPIISPINISPNTSFIKGNKLKFKVKDSSSGIKSYNAFANNEWVILRYDKKNHLMWIDREDIPFTGKAELSIQIQDLGGNLAKKNYSINLK